MKFSDYYFICVMIIIIVAASLFGCNSWIISYYGNDNPKVEYGGIIGNDTWYRVTNGLNKSVHVFLECPDEMLLSLEKKSEVRFIYNNLDRTLEQKCRIVYWNIK